MLNTYPLVQIPPLAQGPVWRQPNADPPHHGLTTVFEGTPLQTPRQTPRRRAQQTSMQMPVQNTLKHNLFTMAIPLDLSTGAEVFELNNESSLSEQSESPTPLTSSLHQSSAHHSKPPRARQHHQPNHGLPIQPKSGPAGNKGDLSAKDVWTFIETNSDKRQCIFCKYV